MEDTGEGRRERGMGKNDVNTVIMYECLLKENFTFKRREIDASFMCRINKVSKQIME